MPDLRRGHAKDSKDIIDRTNDMSTNEIIIKNARENNLKGVTITIPKNKITAFVGVSGSGKTSLVFDTVAAESMHQLYDTFPVYVRSRLPYYPVPKADAIENLTTAIVIDQKPFSGDVRSTVGTMTELAPQIRLLYSRFADNKMPTSNMYSFNDPEGMCARCSGLGRVLQFDMDKIVDADLSLNEGALKVPGFGIDSCFWQVHANSGLFDNDKPLRDYSEEEWKELLHGDKTRIVEIKNNTGKVWEGSYNLTYEGYLDRINRLYLETKSKQISKSKQNVIDKFAVESVCPSCGGRRLKQEALNSLIGGKNIWELGEMDMDELNDFLGGIESDGAEELIKSIRETLRDISNIGLGYLNLNRVSSTLSGGETQRLKIIKHLRSSLTGITYIFDEPGAGLHTKDIDRLNKLLVSLRDKGNTVLIVEHNRKVISIADHVVEMGPGAGTAGGEKVFEGTYDKLLSSGTKTGRWLSKAPVAKKCGRSFDSVISLKNCSANNLKGFDLDIPEKVLTVITGPSGSGKSTLVQTELMKQRPDAVYIGQKFIGTSSRSNTASYVGVMDEIRKLFAKESGRKAGLFSFNSEGACPYCKGKGTVTTEMAFMDPITVKCECCMGKRYNEEALSYKLKGKSIDQVMDMTVSEAITFFDDVKKIKEKLLTLEAVGMDYVTLKQTTSSMSGGDCQRLKLAAHLKSKEGIYVLDEPAAGLHGKDIALLMKLLDDMVERGNTVIVVEHNPDIICCADWIIDMGPGGGRSGGQVVYEGRQKDSLV